MSVGNSDLGFLGIDYQYRLAHHLIDDKKFFCDIVDIVDANMFTDANLKKIISTLKNYHEIHGLVPSDVQLEIELRADANNEQTREFYLATLQKIKETSPEGCESIKTQAQRFFKQQNFVKFHNEIAQLLKTGNVDKFDELQELWEKAFTAGNRDSIGISLKDNIGDVLTEDYRSTIPTGVRELDNAMEGGLGKGELGVIIGPAGFGKTSLTTAIANHAASIGHNVCQIVFEDKEKQIQRKHFARIAEIEAKDISKPENIEYVRELIKNNHNFDKTLRIKKFNTGEISPIMIKNYLKRLINSGFKPELVIIDYFECLVPSKSFKDQWQAEGHMMRQLESIASDLDIAIWVPTQGTKDALNAEIVTMDKAGGSFKKMQIAHVIISIARALEDIERNIATIAMLKNRSGKSGIVLEGIYFNNGTCVISSDRGRVYDNFNDYKDSGSEREKDMTKELLERRMEKKNKKQSAQTNIEPF